MDIYEKGRKILIATARITVAPRQAIGPDINDLVPAKGDIIGIAGAAFHEVIPHPLKLPPQPVFKHRTETKLKQCCNVRRRRSTYAMSGYGRRF